MAFQNAIGFFESLGKQPITYNDYFFPSKDEMKEMAVEVSSHGLGGFDMVQHYPCSSESNYFIGSSIWETFTDDGFQRDYGMKTATYLIRACRAFTSVTNYNLRDIGPAGGYIFWKSGNNYLETAPFDLNTDLSVQWSNILDVEVGTGTAIGTGQANTTAIINQVGHTASAAKLCNDLIVYH